MFEQDINYINKLITLRQLGYNVIDNVEFEILDDAGDLAVYTDNFTGSDMTGIHSETYSI